MKNYGFFLIFILIGLWQTASATVADSMYATTYPVASQAQSDWQDAIPKALEQVLIKISGNALVTQSPKIHNQLSQSTNLVQSYSYINTTGPDGKNQLQLQIQFNREGIDRLLAQAKVAVWDQQRPLTLVWLAVKTDQNQFILSSDNSNLLLPILQKSADRRGMPILLPMMDLEDKQKITVENIATLDPQTLTAASQRYGASNLLEGKIYPGSNGQFYGEWMLLLHNNESLHGQVQGSDENDVTAKLIDDVADTIGGRLATAKPEEVKQQKVVMHVSNVNGLDDYNDVVNYLRGLAPVVEVEVVNLDNTDVVLNVTIKGDAQVLTDAIGTGSQMQAIVATTTDPSAPNNNVNAANSELNYRWSASTNNDNNAVAPITSASMDNAVTPDQTHNAQ